MYRWLPVLLVACHSLGPNELPIPPEGEGFQINEGHFTVPTGRDATFCMNYPMPERYGYGPQFIVGVESKLPKLTHHYFMAYDEGELSAPEPCLEEGAVYFGDVEGAPDPHGDNGKMVFGAPEGNGRYFLPPGYGLYLDTGRGHFSTSHHVLNTSEADADMWGVINVFTAPREEIKHPINILNCLLKDIHVPANEYKAVSGTCLVPWDIDMVVLGSHAHQHLDRFEMRVFDGEKTLDEVIYTSTDWDSPEVVVLHEPLRLKQGQGLTFTCHYDNRTDHELTFGVGDYGEMCATMSGYALPGEGDVPPPLGSLVLEEGSSIILFDTSEIDGPF